MLILNCTCCLQFVGGAGEERAIWQCDMSCCPRHCVTRCPRAPVTWPRRHMTPHLDRITDVCVLKRSLPSLSPPANVLKRSEVKIPGSPPSPSSFPPLHRRCRQILPGAKASGIMLMMRTTVMIATTTFSCGMRISENYISNCSIVYS